VARGPARPVRRALRLEGDLDTQAPAAVQVGDLVLTSAHPRRGADREIGSPGDAAAQAREALEAIRTLVDEAGGGLEDVLDVVSFHSDVRSIEPVLEIAREYFPSDFPAWTPIGVTAQTSSGVALTLSAVARLGEEPKRSFVPDTIAWWRRYPVSAGCRKGDLLFVAGQYGSDADGNVNTPGDHAGQARNALNRVREICGLAGGSLDDVLDVVSFHQDPRWIPMVQATYEAEFFDESAGPAFPAWTAVGTPGLIRLGMVGQYKAIADLRPGRRLGSTIPELGWNGAHIAGAVRKEGGTLIAVTGVVAADRHGRVADRGDPEGQARSAFERMHATLDGLGASLADVVQLTSFHLDPDSMEVATRVSREYFDADHAPASRAAVMTGFWQEGQLHSIHALAVCEP
jgi:enamine deaminase RidA (YjgF/YER057c/UK114 family)